MREHEGRYQCRFYLVIGSTCTVRPSYVDCDDTQSEIAVVFSFDDTVENPDDNTFVRVSSRDEDTGIVTSLPHASARCERATPGRDDGLVMGANIVLRSQTPPATDFENELKNQCDLDGFGGLNWQARVKSTKGSDGGKLVKYRSKSCGFLDFGCEVFAHVCIGDDLGDCNNPGNPDGNVNNNYPSASCTKGSKSDKSDGAKTHTFNPAVTSPEFLSSGRKSCVDIRINIYDQDPGDDDLMQYTCWTRCSNTGGNWVENEHEFSTLQVVMEYKSECIE